ncbi:hypothetical protein [Erythrobacter rubeus]|uniref:Uncharacterized protein n=1 Tax=Erythrobacter rubeus TaxID=2760803 RepID=A0ABR8KT51_9SPHN|nr:hypothetical protein [Erythrobacter rubeus]MBD2842602.1 hypothetical protein [Erythrobacter rubeus]
MNPIMKPGQAKTGQSAAHDDVLEAYARFVQNHSGLYDLQNPDFPSQLATARARFGRGRTGARQVWIRKSASGLLGGAI